MKPRSSIWSASSNTKISTLLRSICLWLTRSNILPGVAMRISTPLSNFLIWGACSTPPTKAMMLSSVCLPISLNTCAIWIANSRVGTITKHFTWLYLLWWLRRINKCKIGMAKAAVFPVPVWAIPNTSSPFKIEGMALNWISVGFLNPNSSKLCLINGEILYCSNFICLQS